jgi:putative MATE family efflux protein
VSSEGPSQPSPRRGGSPDGRPEDRPESRERHPGPSPNEAVAPSVEAAGPLTEFPEPPRRNSQGLTADGRLKSGKLAGLTMGSAIITISWPVLVDSFLNSFVGLTDTVLAAGISEAATDAIGSASYILWFVGLVFIALDVGATALISRSVGAGRMAVANAGVGQTVLLAVGLGAVVGVLIGAAAAPLAVLMGLKGEAGEAFRIYLWILAADVPLMAVLFAGIACLRGGGDSLRPMRAMVVVNIVNIVASWVLAGVDIRTTSIVAGEQVTRTVLHNPFGFDLGIAGIALGTLMAHAAGAFLILRTLAGRGVSPAGKAEDRLTTLRLRARRLRPHWVTMKRIVRVGIPNFLETLGMWFGNFLIILMVGWLGAGYVGAHILAIRIEAFSFQPGFAMGLAAATLAGQYLGAGSPRMAKRAVALCTAIASAIMGVVGLVFIFFPEQVVGLFSSQPTHLRVAPQCLFIVGLVQIPFAVSIVLRSAMRGAGDVKAVMWMTWITTYAIRLPLAYIFSGVNIPVPEALGGGVLANPFGFEPSLAGLWVGLCAELVFRGAMFAYRFVQGGWTRHRV